MQFMRQFYIIEHQNAKLSISYGNHDWSLSLKLVFLQIKFAFSWKTIKTIQTYILPDYNNKGLAKKVDWGGGVKEP